MTAGHPGYVIRAARVIDPATSDVLRDACIHIQDGRIAGRSSSAPAGLPVIDAGAAALLPGLIDCHTHLLLRPEDQVWPPAITFKTRPYRMAEGVAAARRALEIGFTSARDTGNEGAVHCDTALRQAIDAGIVPGPRLQVATDAISITAGDMALVSEVNPELGLADPAAMADTRDEMIKQVRRQVKIGADWIKIYCTGTRKHVDPRTMEPLHQMTAEDVSVIVAEAARYRRDVAAHAYGGDGAQAAILGGARTLEHGPLLTEDDLQLLREHGTFWVPTLGTYHVRQHTDFDRRFVQRHEGAFRRALKLGVRVAFGTDIGSYDHGQQMREFTLMVRYGMEPIAAIRSATTIAAEVLRLGGQIGTLANGARADLIAVDGDPLADIESLSRVHLVVKDGRVFRDDLGLAAKLPEAAWTPARLSPSTQVLLSDRLQRLLARAGRTGRLGSQGSGGRQVWADMLITQSPIGVEDDLSSEQVAGTRTCRIDRGRWRRGREACRGRRRRDRLCRAGQQIRPAGRHASGPAARRRAAGGVARRLAGSPCQVMARIWSALGQKSLCGLV